MMIAMPKKAMILAAGLGTRMRAYTSAIPKPLVPVAEKPLIDWALDLLEHSGVKEVIVNTSYMADILEEHLAERNTPVITISREETPLETGGGIKKALSLLGNEPFFVLNSDVISLNGPTPLLKRLCERWEDEKMDALLLVAPTTNATGYNGQGDFELSGFGTLRRRAAGETVPYVFAGVQLLHPRIFQESPSGAFSMNVLYNRGIDSQGRLQRVVGMEHDGLWMHVGDPQGKYEAEKRLKTLA